MIDFGSIIDSVFIFASVLALGALCGFFSEKVGIANISIDGQMIFGAFIFCIFAEICQKTLGNNSFILPILISSVGTLLASSLFAFLTIKLKTNQIVAGTAINLLTLGLATFLTEPLGPILNPDDAKLTNHYTPIEQFGDSGIFLSSFIILLLTIVLVIGLYLLVKKTPFGLRMCAIGENPYAVDSQGINVEKYQWIALSIGGLLAGLSGGIFMYGQSGTQFNGDVMGLGFLALAILISGSWKIPLISIVSIVFAFITKTIDKSSSISGISSDIGKLIPYAITLGWMVIFSKYITKPKFTGQVYVHGVR